MTRSSLDTIPRTPVREFTDTTHPYLPADPYAEGARAARAGLTLLNPYRLWPCVAAQYEAGFRGDVL